MVKLLSAGLNIKMNKFKVGDWVKHESMGIGIVRCEIDSDNQIKVVFINIDDYYYIYPHELKLVYPKFKKFEDNFMTLKESMKTRILTDSEKLKIVEDKLISINKRLENISERIGKLEKGGTKFFTYKRFPDDFPDSTFTIMDSDTQENKKEEIKNPKFEVGESCCIILHNLENLGTDVVCRSIKKVEKVKVDAATNKIKYKISDCDWHYHEHEMYKTNDPKILKVGDKVRVIEPYLSGLELIKKGTNAEIRQIYKDGGVNDISIDFRDDNIRYLRCIPFSKIELVLD